MDGREEGAPGWTVDRYGDALLVRCFALGGASVAELAELLAGIEALAGNTLSVYLKEVRAGDPGRGAGRLLAGPASVPIVGDLVEPRPGRMLVHEEGMRFAVDLCHGHNTGLFADARAMRRWVRQHSEGRRILNLFSYTAAFGVAAGLGGARSVENVDMVASAVERGRANYALNGLSGDSRSHVRGEVFAFLKQAARRSQCWDGIIADPPPVATPGKGRGFRPGRDQGRLLQHIVRCLAPGAWLLAMSGAYNDSAFAEQLRGAHSDELCADADYLCGVVPGLRARVLYSAP
jgi:23S rRNA (cytosine1962-C5)-methyltransferase